MPDHLAAMLTGAACLSDWLLTIAAATALGLIIQAALRAGDERDGRALVERRAAAAARGRRG